MANLQNSQDSKVELVKRQKEEIKQIFELVNKINTMGASKMQPQSSTELEALTKDSNLDLHLEK